MGERDLITNHVNLMWYTPKDSLAGNVYNGFCTEYCGSSHANMRLRVYAVTAAQFESWAAHQKEAAAGSPIPAPTVVTVAGVAGAPKKAAAPPPTQPATEGYVFPTDKLASWNVPQTPLPTGDGEVKFDEALLAQGDAARGHELVAAMANMGKAPCLTCHIIKGEYVGVLKSDNDAKGPNLSHFATRHTFAGGIYGADPKTLARS